LNKKKKTSELNLLQNKVEPSNTVANEADLIIKNVSAQNNETATDKETIEEVKPVVKTEAKQNILTQIKKVVEDDVSKTPEAKETAKPSYKLLNNQSNAVIIPSLIDLESKIELDDTIKEAQKITEAEEKKKKVAVVLQPNKVQESLSVYANLLKQQSKNVLGSLVNTVQFTINGPLVQMLVDSKVKAQQLSGIKENLLIHLKAQLNESDVQLKIGFIERTKTIETQTIAYSPKERLNEIMNENPNVKDFIEKLDLNFEY